MGHERVGALPKTKQWKNVVNQIVSFENNASNISGIAQSTLKNVRRQLDNIENDSGVRSAFSFLILLSLAGKRQDPIQFLLDNNVRISEKPTPLEISRCLNTWISTSIDSNEYSAVARSSAIDTIAEWHDKNKSQQTNIFDASPHLEVWKKAASASGFCEVARLFFSKFTERYLNYFLERTASASLSSIQDRERFGSELKKHVDQISKHSFETAKITQSFAAGWFTKNVINELPTEKKIKGFLNIAFGKLKSELLREESAS